MNLCQRFFLKIGIFLSFNATTEQPVFVSLLLYRLVPYHEITRISLLFTSFYTVFTKSVFFVIVILEIAKFKGVVPGHEYDWQPDVGWQRTMFVVITVLACLLFMVQLRCSKVHYNLSKKSGLYYERIIEFSPAGNSRRSSVSVGSASSSKTMLWTVRSALKRSWRRRSFTESSGERTPELVELTDNNAGVQNKQDGE